MPTSERPTTLKKLIKRYFTRFEHPYQAGPTCSGCSVSPRISDRQLTNFPRYLTVALNREDRVAGVRCFSKRICEVNLQTQTKLFGQRYAVGTVIVRQDLEVGSDGTDGTDSSNHVESHYYTYCRNQRTGEWHGYLNGIVVKVQVQQIMQVVAEKAICIVLHRLN